MLAWSFVGSANQVHGLALIAFLQGMGVEEFGPVRALFGGENAGSLAERAAVFQGIQNGVSDEFGFIGHLVQGFGQCFIGLEGDGFLFFVAHVSPLDADMMDVYRNTKYYLCKRECQEGHLGFVALSGTKRGVASSFSCGIHKEMLFCWLHCRANPP